MSDYWTHDDEGCLRGEWVEIDGDEYRAIVDAAGGIKALTVFSTLTDPEGVYGEPRIYTAWGFRDHDTPLVDSEGTDLDEGIAPSKWRYRKFVARDPSAHRV